MPSIQPDKQRGFTLVEMLIVAPIILLTIATFIGAVIYITGDVLRSRTSNTLAFTMQDSLGIIEQDIRLSGAFLAQNNFDPEAPQGRNSTATRFASVSSTYGPSLILNASATTNTTESASRSLIYLANAPNSCGSSTANQNQVMTYNIVYFIQNDSDGTSSLWRRVVMPDGYDVAGCQGVPLQLPTCSPGSMSNTYCKARDTRLLRGVAPAGLAIQYFTDPQVTTEPANTNSTDLTLRTAALKDVVTAQITITAEQTVAGQAVDYTVTLRASRLGPYNATAMPDMVAPAITTHPSNMSASVGGTVTFVSVASGTNPSIQWQQSTNNGTTWTNIAGQTYASLPLTGITSGQNNYLYRAVYTNGRGTATTNSARLTVL